MRLKLKKKVEYENINYFKEKHNNSIRIDFLKKNKSGINMISIL